MQKSWVGLRGFNVGLKLRNELLPTVWDSSRNMIRRHAITILIHGDKCSRIAFSRFSINIHFNIGFIITVIIISVSVVISFYGGIVWLLLCFTNTHISIFKLICNWFQFNAFTWISHFHLHVTIFYWTYFAIISLDYRENLDSTVALIPQF